MFAKGTLPKLYFFLFLLISTQRILDSLVTIQSEIKRLSVRQNNSQCVLPTDDLQPILLDDGTASQNFPLSQEAFDNMSAEQCGEILDTYKLTTTGSTAVCRRCLARFLELPCFWQEHVLVVQPVE
jgi:hypothetical protein